MFSVKEVIADAAVELAPSLQIFIPDHADLKTSVASECAPAALVRGPKARGNAQSSNMPIADQRTYSERGAGC